MKTKTRYSAENRRWFYATSRGKDDTSCWMPSDKHLCKSKRGGPSVLKFAPRKISKEQVLNEVRELVLKIKARAIESRNRHEWMPYPSLTVEGMATELKVERAKVHWSFMVLNREGLLEQQRNGLPHDGRNTYNVWQATRYDLRMPPRPVHKDEDMEIVPSSPRNTMSVWEEKETFRIPRKPRYSKRLKARVGT